jgi:hypothetical protein
MPALVGSPALPRLTNEVRDARMFLTCHECRAAAMLSLKVMGHVQVCLSPRCPLNEVFFSLPGLRNCSSFRGQPILLPSMPRSEMHWQQHTVLTR